MASALKNLSMYNDDNIPNGLDYRVTIIVSQWNQDITFKMHDECVDTLMKHQVKEDHIKVYQVPGTFELPISAKWAMNYKNQDAIILLGCVIQGETKHDDYINHATAQAIQQLNIETGIPCIFGVVTTNNKQQAIDRSGGKHGNKGVEAAITALRMIDLKHSMKGKGSHISFGNR